ncbi:MAG: PaaI family thioesterase, partial [Tomitella sp.]|nr:PaaI family thioesterase [Tomitella sp.]
MVRGGFNGTFGLHFLEASGDRIRVEWEVTPGLHQPYGIVHGGVYCSVIETVASVGAQLWLAERGNVVGVNNNTNFLRAVREGRLDAVAVPVHR